MAEYTNPWLENFEREAQMRRCLILSGNVNDIQLDRNDQLVTVDKLLSDYFRERGYKHIVSYDINGYVRGISLKDWNELGKVSGSANENNSQPNNQGGNPYDMGNANNQAPVGRGFEIEAPDFFSKVEAIIKNSQDQVAIIVDHANYYYGNASNLNEVERGCLIELANGLRHFPISRFQNDVNGINPILVYLVSGSLNLPTSIYLNNAHFKEIVLPNPSKNERKAAIKSREQLFNIVDSLYDEKNLEEFAVITDNLQLRDIVENISRLSQNQSPPMSVKNLVTLYRNGKRQSPWEKLDYNRLREIKEYLRQRVKGQDEAIDVCRKVLIRAYTGLTGVQHSAKARSPRGALFFVGPTGVGKTELAKTLSQFLFGDEDSFVRFDMSEFNHEHADQRLVGSPPGYVGFEDGGELTNAIKARPFSLVLFDEIEKAHPRILDKFLQILEDGRLTDGKGETVSFTDTFIVFTSNIGAADINYNQGTPAEIREIFKQSVASHFRDKLKRPEILGRIGDANIVPFNFMTDPVVLMQICQAKVKPIAENLRQKWGVRDFILDDSVYRRIVANVNMNEGGRGVVNSITKTILDPLADFIFVQASQPGSLQNATITGSSFNNSVEFYLM